MIDPVVASDGHTYERYAIQDVLNRNGTSPITRERLTPHIHPNRTLKSIMNTIAETNQDFRNEYERVRTELPPPPPVQNPRMQASFTNEGLRQTVRDYLNEDTRNYIVQRYGEIGEWNVSNVTDMSSMFRSAESFNQPLNNWNVSNVTNMGGMFMLTLSFNQPLNNWNVSNLEFMHFMFNDSPLENNSPNWYR